MLISANNCRIICAYSLCLRSALHPRFASFEEVKLNMSEKREIPKVRFNQEIPSEFILLGAKLTWLFAYGYSVVDALKFYNNERRFRVWFYQLNSSMLTPVFQSRSRVLAALRDSLMGPMCYFPPTKRQMLTTLVGAQKKCVSLYCFEYINEKIFYVY